MKPSLAPLNIQATRDPSSPEPDEDGVYDYGATYSSSPTAEPSQMDQTLSDPSSTDAAASWEDEWPYTTYSPTYNRKDSESSTASHGSSGGGGGRNATTHSRSNSHSQSSHSHSRNCSSGSSRKSPTVNRYTHCGRHTDQFLFGGLSLTGMVKSALRKDSTGAGGSGSRGAADGSGNSSGRHHHRNSHDGVTGRQNHDDY